MGGAASELRKVDYNEIKEYCTVNTLRRNRSVERRVNIKEAILDPIRKQTKRKNKKIATSIVSKLKRSYSCGRDITIYRKGEKIIPINKFFIKFFKPIQKKLIKQKNLDDSDLNFSDLDCLKLYDSELENDKTEAESNEDYQSKLVQSKRSSRSSLYSIFAGSKSCRKFEKEKEKEKLPPLNVKISDIPSPNSSEELNVVVKPNSLNIMIPNLLDSLSVKKEMFNFSNKSFIETLPGLKSKNKYQDNTLRNSYYSKLVMKNILPTKQATEKNNIFIFDWDDTLLCTSHISPLGVFKETPQISSREKKLLSDLEEIILDILNFAIIRGNVYIITNAVSGWVEHSASVFYPKVAKLLEKITVISARSEFEWQYPADNKLWKIHTFLNLSKVFDVKALTNIICMGDSKLEIEASQILFSQFEKCYLKSIKFREYPKPEDLIKELKLVRDKIEIIYSSVKSLTINVEKRSKKGSNSTNSTTYSG